MSVLRDTPPPRTQPGSAAGNGGLQRARRMLHNALLGAAAVVLAGAAVGCSALSEEQPASTGPGQPTGAEQPPTASATHPTAAASTAAAMGDAEAGSPTETKAPTAKPEGQGDPKQAGKPGVQVDTPDAEAKKTRYLVAAMGDSLTDPRSKGGRYLEYLRKQCPKSRFDSYGVGGNMVNQMRRRFLRDIYGEPALKGASKKEARPQYTHVMVLGGINDICSDESANRTNDKIKNDLSAMYAMARERGAKVIALTMPPWAGFTRYYNRRRANSTFEVNAWIRQRHKAGDVDALLDVYPIMSCGKEEFLCEDYGWSDKVHWNKAGHTVVGKALHKQLFSDCE